MKFLILLILCSCSYVHYRQQNQIAEGQAYIHKLERPLLSLHPYFEMEIAGKSRPLQELNYDEKMIVFSLFPRINEFTPKQTLYTLKKMIVFEENITSNLTPSIFSVFSVISMGVFPSYVTSSFKGELIIINNQTGKEKVISYRPKYIKGMGAFFAIWSYKENWFDTKEDPYRNNLSEYFQNYFVHQLGL